MYHGLHFILITENANYKYGDFTQFMKDNLDDQIWYAILRNILEYEAHCNLNKLDMVHVDFPALFGDNLSCTITTVNHIKSLCQTYL